MCPSVTMDDLKIPLAEDVKYLELYLNCRLNWKKTHTQQAKIIWISIGNNALKYLFGTKSQLSAENKPLQAIQGNSQIYLDLCHPIVGHGLQFRYRNIIKIPKQIP